MMIEREPSLKSQSRRLRSEFRLRALAKRANERYKKIEGFSR